MYSGARAYLVHAKRAGFLDKTITVSEQQRTDSGHDRKNERTKSVHDANDLTTQFVVPDRLR